MLILVTLVLLSFIFPELGTLLGMNFWFPIIFGLEAVTSCIFFYFNFEYIVDNHKAFSIFRPYVLVLTILIIVFGQALMLVFEIIFFVLIIKDRHKNFHGIRKLIVNLPRKKDDEPELAAIKTTVYAFLVFFLVVYIAYLRSAFYEVGYSNIPLTMLAGIIPAFLIGVFAFFPIGMQIHPETNLILTWHGCYVAFFASFGAISRGTIKTTV